MIKRWKWNSQLPWKYDWECLACVCVCVCVWIHTHIHDNKERKIQTNLSLTLIKLREFAYRNVLHQSVCACICMYVYMFVFMHVNTGICTSHALHQSLRACLCMYVPWQINTCIWQTKWQSGNQEKLINFLSSFKIKHLQIILFLDYFHEKPSHMNARMHTHTQIHA